MTEPESTPLPPDWQAYFRSLEQDILGLKQVAAKKPWWNLDTRASLAVSIVVLMISSILMLVLLSILNVKVDPTIFAVLTTLLGVLAGSFKDVYGFWYGNSSGNSNKDDTITKMAAASSGTSNGMPLVTVEPPANVQVTKP